MGREREKQQPPGQGARGEAGIWSWELGSGIWMRMWEMGRREQATGNREEGGIIDMGKRGERGLWVWEKRERERYGQGRRGKGYGYGKRGRGRDMGTGG